MTTSVSTPAQQAADFLTELRIATGPMHRQLETTPLSVALMSPGITQAEYANYLFRMRDVIAWCEATVFPLVKNAISDIDNRRKLPAIEADIEVTGPATIGSKSYEPVDGTMDEAFALGYMYVIEGSTLGGRVILKHLAGSGLNITEDRGGSFFAGYREGTSAQWKKFLDEFTSYTIGNEVAARVTAGAQHAFTSIYDHFMQRPANEHS